MYVMLPVLGQGYTTWMENCFSSCRLYDFLHYNKTKACGTMRSNGVPPEVRNAKLALGEVSTFHSVFEVL